ncbi:MAG: hypothetical protein AB1742_16025 [bacterium]
MGKCRQGVKNPAADENVRNTRKKTGTGYRKGGGKLGSGSRIGNTGQKGRRFNVFSNPEWWQ